MSSRILVHIYSYKDSELVNSVDKLLENLSGSNSVDIYVDDQNNLTRYEKFLKHKDVFYNPVWWDSLPSPLSYRASCLETKKQEGYDYFLFITRSTILNKDWDKDLIKSLPQSAVFSGQGSVECKIENNFYIRKDRSESSIIVNTGMIDQSFVFGRFDDLQKIEIPYKLKYFGIEEYMSMAFLNNDVDIYSLPSGFYFQHPDNLVIKDYVPFSLNHNYNDVIDMIKGNQTSVLRYESPDKFLNKNHIDPQSLYRLPFDFNDIEYDRFSELDLVGGVRYIEKRKQVS
jgi:hypothetical protein